MNFMGLKMKRPYRFSIGPLFSPGTGLSRRHHVYGLARLLAVHRVVDLAGDARDQGVVAAHADVRAGMDHRAALAHQDLAGVDALAAVDLDAEALRLGVA